MIVESITLRSKEGRKILDTSISHGAFKRAKFFQLFVKNPIVPLMHDFFLIWYYALFYLLHVSFSFTRKCLTGCQQMSTKKGDINANKYYDPAYPAYQHLSTVVAEKQRTRNLPEVYNF